MVNMPEIAGFFLKENGKNAVIIVIIFQRLSLITKLWHRLPGKVGGSPSLVIVKNYHKKLSQKSAHL